MNDLKFGQPLDKFSSEELEAMFQDLDRLTGLVKQERKRIAAEIAARPAAAEISTPEA